MANRPEAARSAPLRAILRTLVTSAAIVGVATACSPLGKKTARTRPPLNVAQKPPKALLTPKNPLHIATTYWANQYQRNPADPQAALNYAKNLRAIGATERAYVILKQAHGLHPQHTEIASEFGRLALKKGQTDVALNALRNARLPKGGTDWRVLSALGAAHATLGQHKKAQEYFQAALAKQPHAPSVLNNLALSYAMNGQPKRAEALLRDAIKAGQDSPRVRQNLALVLGVQSKFGEAEKLASVDLSDRKARANIAFLRSMVRDRTFSEAQPRRPLSPRLAEAPRPKAPAKSVPLPERKVATLQPEKKALPMTSRTMPLPWARPQPVPPAKTRTAATTLPAAEPKPKPAAKSPRKPAATPSAPIPLPDRKPKALAAPERTVAEHKPRPRERITPPARPAEAVKEPLKAPKLPWAVPDAATPPTAWRTTVAQDRSPRRRQSLLYPELD